MRMKPVSLITIALIIVRIFAHDEDTVNGQNEQPPGDQEIWTVYDRSNFGESELCQVLNCRRRDYCLVKGEDAICLNRKQLREAPGRKVFYGQTDGLNIEKMPESTSRGRSSKSGIEHMLRITTTKTPNENNNNAMEWDPERVRQKLANHYRSLKRKQRNRAAQARPNLYEIPFTFNENASDKTTNARGSRGKRHCTDEQLRDIGVRLFQWFSDMMAHHEPGSSSIWQRHHRAIPCHNEPRWMFNQLDHDTNEILDADELYALTYDQYEPCVKPFLDRCDRNMDARLSIQEWCTCFNKIS